MDDTKGWSGPIIPIKTPTSPPAVVIASKKADDLRNQVDNVVKIMQSNLDQVIIREGSLQNLETRAQVVNENSAQFRHNTAAVRRKLWWKNIRMNFVICLFILSLIICVIFAFVLPSKTTPPAEVTPPGHAPGTNPDPGNPVVDPNDQNPN